MSLRAAAYLTFALAVAAAGASGQAAGPTYFVAGAVLENGGLTRDNTYSLIGQVGGAPVGGRAATTLHVLAAGFPSVVDPVVSGATAAPWPMAVRPRFVDVDPASDGIFTLRGAELVNGGRPSLTLGGKFAAVITAGGSSILFRLDTVVVPGWRRLDVVTSKSSTSLPTAVGVRPLLALEEPAAPDRSVRLLLHARPGDTLMLGASWGLGSARPIAPFHHALHLNPALWIYLGAFPVTAADGRLALALPAIGLTNGIHMQGLALTVGAPYAPGSFTNTLAL